MKVTNYLIALLAIGLLSPAILAQQDPPASETQTPRKEKADPGERRVTTKEKQLGEKAMTDGETQKAKALRRAAQLKKKQAAGEELTDGERQELLALRATLGDQGRPKSLKKRPAAAEDRLEKKAIAGDEVRDAQRAKVLRRAKQLQKKQAAGEELTESERQELRALKPKLGDQPKLLDQPKRGVPEAKYSCA